MRPTVLDILSKTPLSVHRNLIFYLKLNQDVSGIQFDWLGS